MKKQTHPTALRGAGYTILEVMIFLAISGFIMAAAMNLIRGKQAETDFTQKMRDTQSQLQSWISASSAGFTGADPTKQSCTAPGGSRPTVKNIAPGPVYTPQCVFLGEAVQFPQDPAKGSTIYAYPVFGVRLNGGELPTDLNTSMPTPTAGQSGNIDLSQPFSLLPLYVRSVKSSGLDCSVTPCSPSSNTTSHLVGFYGSINTDTSTANNGESDVNAYQYNFGGSTTRADSQVINCLQMSPSCGFSPSSSYPDKLTKLTVCLTDGDHFAQLLVNSGNGIGADVTINYPDSLANC